MYDELSEVPFDLTQFTARLEVGRGGTGWQTSVPRAWYADRLAIEVSNRFATLPVKAESRVFPKTWWDAFKLRWFPAWALRRWPATGRVRVTAEVRAVWPDWPIPEEMGSVRFYKHTSYEDVEADDE